MLIRVVMAVALTATVAQAGTVEDAFRAVVEAREASVPDGYARPAASGKGVAVTRDSKVVMASKDVGQERWSIVWGDNLLRMRGVVYSPGGGAQFIECDVVDLIQLGSEPNLHTDSLVMHCYGGSGVVAPGTWESIAVGLRFPLSFFLP